MNKLFCITGPSGVGKTTISKILSICLGHQNTTILSGDDSHLWERNDENWKFITHLNPEANDLKTELKHLSLLKKGEKVSRKIYNHYTGKFTEPQTITPKKNIIYEGLHAMYGEISKQADVSFYIEVEPSLKNEWKVSRDSRKRGYTIEEIVKTIESRKQAEKKFIEPQKNNCDVILKFKRTHDESISLSFEYKRQDLVWLINKIKKLYNLLGEFVYVSKKISNNIDLCQNKGGNLSFKFDNTLVITESGSSFDKINYFEGFGFYDLTGKSIFKNQKRPSMEIDAHMKLGTCCLHTHPLHVLAILCSQECESILSDLKIEKKIINYCTPGKNLAEIIESEDDIFFKNHGIFISRNSMIEAFEYTQKLDEKCKIFLKKRSTKKEYLYPDAFVLKEENRFYHSYIKDILSSSGLTPKCLSKEEVKKLDKMEEENYRRLL